LSLSGIRLYDLFQFVFYEVISVLWHRSQVCELTWIDPGHFIVFFFSYWFFFQCHYPTINLLWIVLHNLFWFYFYDIFSVSRPSLWVWQVNSYYFLVFYEVISVSWPGLWVDKLTWVNSSYFLWFFKKNYFFNFIIQHLVD